MSKITRVSPCDWKNGNFSDIIKLLKISNQQQFKKIFSEVFEKLKAPSCSLTFEDQSEFVKISKVFSQDVFLRGKIDFQ